MHTADPPDCTAPDEALLSAGLLQVLLLLLRRQLLLLEVPLRTRRRPRQVATPMPLQHPIWRQAVPWSRASTGWVPDCCPMHLQAAMLIVPSNTAAPAEHCRSKAKQLRSIAVPLFSEHAVSARRTMLRKPTTLQHADHLCDMLQPTLQICCVSCADHGDGL